MSEDLSKKVLVAGGSGYIGSHTVVELLNAGYEPVVIDNFANSSKVSVDRVQEITGKSVKFYQVDLLNAAELEKVFQNHKFGSVIHFAGLKAVGESVQKPVEYYHNNVTGTLILLQMMNKYGVKNLVFSSSATVYGYPERLPLDEDCRTSCTNPYGRTKLFIEEIVKDVIISDSKFNAILLRYFNPSGAHKSGKIGEDPKGIPNNLMPFVAQVAVGKREYVSVFGNDYDTPDGTGVRDYIHVVDLALGHLQAIKRFEKGSIGCEIYNLGTGRGYSVLEMLRAMGKAVGKEIPYKIVGRRPGDVASVYADPKLANEKLNWKATRGLEEMCEDLWRWQSQNPNGFN